MMHRFSGSRIVAAVAAGLASSRLSSIAVLAALAGLASAGAPPEAAVQGLYEGTGTTPAGAFAIEARVVAQGGGNYKVFVRATPAGGALARVELSGKTAADAVAFTGKAGEDVWKGVYAAGAIKGECGQGGSFQIARVQRSSPTLGKKPAGGATVLLDGKDFSPITRASGAEWYLGEMRMHGWPVWEVPIYVISEKEPAEWPRKDNPLPAGWALSKERRRADIVIGIDTDGSIQMPAGGINSVREFEGGFDMHVEFMTPFMPRDRSQGRGNSGVYLPNGDEIQVLDSFGDPTYLGGGCGGLYHYKDPDCMEPIESLAGQPESKFTLASLPPLAWQSYDIEYRVEKKDGAYAGKPRLTVYHNGIKIHDKAALRQNARKGRFHFQDHGNPVRYRNIWVLPVAP